MLAADLSGIATSVAASVAALALLVTARTARDIKRQTEIGHRATARAAAASLSQAYAAVTQHMTYVNKILLDHPDWVPYFYEDVTPPGFDEDVEPPGHEPKKQLEEDVTPPGEQLKRQLDQVCEAIMDFADGLVEQRSTAIQPASFMDWSTWDAYFRFLYNNSPVLRRYIPENFDFYPDYEFASFGYIIDRDRLSGAIRSTWHAREIAEADKGYLELFGSPVPAYVGELGYSWVRTWVITPVDNVPVRELSKGVTVVAQDLGAVVVVAVEIRDARIARLHTRSRGEIPEDTVVTLHSWVMGTLAMSSQIQEAHLLLAPESPPQEYDLRAEPIGGREAYLIRRFPPIPSPKE